MKTIQPYRAAVTSFSSAASAPQHQQSGFEYDSGEYILSVASSHHDASAAASSTCVASALSNKSIVIYDSTSGQVTRRIEKAHEGPISQISFFPCEYGSEVGSTHQNNSNHPPLLISASQDGTVKVFDLRTNALSSAITTKLALPNEQALCVSLGYGGTLAAVGTSKARVSFLDLRYTSGTNPTGALMGSYVDAHTEEVTQVKFQTVSNASGQTRTVLATASEDGLLSIYDPAQPSEDAALLSTLNIGAPLRHIGFFGPNYEGICALTGNETMSVWHWDSAQKVSDVGGLGLRGLLSDAVGKSGLSVEGSSVEYLVGCTWANANCDQATPQSPSDSKALHLLAGNSEGDGYLFRMDADQITPLVHLKGGHRGCIRNFCWVDNGSGGQRLVTGGEDARLCEWDLSGTSSASSLANNHRVASGKVKQVKRDDTSRKKGNKKFGSPY
jgi:WD40 repeat protein